MVWQDYLISIVSVIFSIALIPQVMIGFKKKKKSVSIQTSFPTTAGLYAMSMAFLTLGLYFSALTSLITGSLWYTLLVQ